MTDLLPFTRDEVIAELEREVRKRHEVFGRWVENGFMEQGEKDRRIARIEKAIEWLKGMSE